MRPAYLANLQAVGGRERAGERAIVTLLERLLAVITSHKAKQVLHDLEIRPLPLFSEIAAPASSKVHAFITKRLPQVLAQ